jgi:nucleotide-binding universal stress UspA family protein
VTPLQPSESSPLIVATDGREQSDGALRGGSLLQESMGGWRVFSAAPMIYNFGNELDLRITGEAIEVLREQQRQSVEAQLRRVLGKGTQVEVEVATGDPAQLIKAVAARVDAQLIVSGLGRQRVADRLLGDETALAIIRASRTPVLAVPQDFARVPRDAMVGVDFSEASIHSAQLAVKLIGQASTIYLVNVAPREDVLSIVTGGFAAYELRARAELELIAATLDVPSRMHVQTHVRQGDPGSELLQYAAQTAAQLITVGTRGQGFLARLLLGSVATKVVRASPVAVLVIPPADDASEPAP